MRIISYCLLLGIVLFGLIPAHAQDLYSCIAVGDLPDGSGRLVYSASYNYGTLQSAYNTALIAVNRVANNPRIATSVHNGVCAIVFFSNDQGYAATTGSTIINTVEEAKQLAVDSYGGQPGTAATAVWVIAGINPDQNGNFVGSTSVVLPNRRQPTPRPTPQPTPQPTPRGPTGPTSCSDCGDPSDPLNFECYLKCTGY